MIVEIKKIDNCEVALLKGRLDTAAAQEVASQFQQLMEKADKQLVLDCADMEYISSSGLRLFLSLRKEVAQKQGKLVVKNLSSDVRQVFMMTGFISLFDIE